MAKWWKWLINPIGAAVQTANAETGKYKWANMLLNPGDFLKDTFSLAKNVGGHLIHQIGTGADVTDDGNGPLKTVWDDLTGKSQIELQNRLDRETAEEEYQRNLQAIGDTAAAYEAAGFNRNLMYSQSPAQYNAPNLTAYSGTQKLDRILQKTGQVLGMIPAMYQATAALEGIDQARERTKQSEIKTMSMGMSLLDQGYKLGNLQLTHPFDVSMFTRPEMYGTKRHYYNSSPLVQSGLFQDTSGNVLYDDSVFRLYADAALKNKFDLLASIGIKNSMNQTLNNWRGYQYSLDRRFGAAGRIVGLGTQGLGAVGKLFSPIKLYGK